ncbi:hypothetical protein OF83DRAFT_843875 [Amylostereum chailletii]|nr:hypothetical protein OF83DRAFT_843875 [Amylostereum chailletii]
MMSYQGSYTIPPVPIVLGPTQRPRPTFPVTSNPVPQTPPRIPGSPTQQRVSTSPATYTSGGPFRAPAHKHAHHLHSIPPREKSTRTLIIDHMLWVHGRTRFAQARAELAMTDRTGGPQSRYHPHRERPEGYDEDDEAPSDGENTTALYARAGGPGHPHDEEEDARFELQDLDLARNLRLRAECLEKIVVGMLVQPPQDHPFAEDEPIIAPVAPERPAPPPTPPKSHKHILPNGVRLRLALATVVNDLFARQAPVLRRNTNAGTSASNMSSSGSTQEISTPKSVESVNEPYTQAVAAPPPTTIPPPLLPLSTISSASAFPPHSSAYSPHVPQRTYTPQSQPQSHSQSPYPNQPYPQPPSPAHLRPPSSNIQRASVPTPNARTTSMFLAGADPSTANSPPSLRCPRHLHTSCQICVEATETAPARPRGGGGARGRVQAPVPQGGELSGFKNGSGVGSGLSRPGLRGNVLRRALPGLVDPNATTGEDGVAPPSEGGGRLSELIPRFVRLSALVALELAEEAGLVGGDGEAHEGVRPASAWYMLLAGLLTRAVLEGYLSAGWRGVGPVEVLLGVGLGRAGEREGVEVDGDGGDVEFREFEPDGMPRLREAVGVLFPGVRGLPQEEGERAYELEMRSRLARFFDVPTGTPDLSTHMEDLAWQYPAEPVERAALRFCEAIAKWRGKPELETYKRRPPGSLHGPAPTEPPDADTSVWHDIERYFNVPPPSPTRGPTAASGLGGGLASVNGRKRARSTAGMSEGGALRIRPRTDEMMPRSGQVMVR